MPEILPLGQTLGSAGGLLDKSYALQSHPKSGRIPWQILPLAQNLNRSRCGAVYQKVWVKMWIRLAVKVMTIACHLAVVCEEKGTHSRAAYQTVDPNGGFKLALCLRENNFCWARCDGLSVMVDIVPDHHQQLAKLATIATILQRPQWSEMHGKNRRL